MAKSNKPKAEKSNVPPPIYFKSLTIENWKCFKGEQVINLSDENGKPAQWTVILGNNNTGKTTILRALADLEVKEFKSDNPIGIPNFVHRSMPQMKSLQFDTLEFSVVGKLLTEMGLHSANTSLKAKEYIEYELLNPLQYGKHTFVYNYEEIGSLVIYGYGVSRKMGNSGLTQNKPEDNTASLFSNDIELVNAEEWLLQTYLATQNGVEKAKIQLEKIKRVLVSGILPDIKGFDFKTREEPPFQTSVIFNTDYGNVCLPDLGYGYQASLAWIIDLMKRLFNRYPNAENPLEMPAIVLVDEIDLHLHPEWQRKIIGFLSRHFPSTQFIVTSHSPLIVQSAEQVNLVLLQKEGNHVTITNLSNKNFSGWTVEEILRDLMGLESKIQSENYLKWIRQFEQSLEEEDYRRAKEAYEELAKIMHPDNHLRNLLHIQLESLNGEEV